jgi:O-antigen/teichoic acid export membrane protein
MSAVPSLRARVLQSSSWTLVGYGGSMMLRLASTLIMTRLLVPEVFGIMALASIVEMIMAFLSDVGLSQTIIHSRRGDHPAMLNTAWSIQIIRGFVIWIGCITVAVCIYWLAQTGFVAPDSVYGTPELPLVIGVLSFGSVIVGFESIRLITAHRNLDLQRLTFVTLTAQFAGLIVMTILGWLTRSIWAFVFGLWVQSIVLVVLSHTWLPGHRDRLQWDKEALSELMNYGRWVLLSSTVYVVAANGDRLLLSGWTDAATLGMYALAFNLSRMMSDAGEKLYFAVGMPAMSEKVRNDPAALRHVYFGFRKPLDLLFLISAGFLFASGQLVIDVLYDDRYAAAGPMLQILSFALLFSRFGIAYNAYLALGQPRYYLAVNVVKLVAVFGALPIAYALFGLTGAIWASALHMAGTVPLVFWFNQKYALNSVRFELVVLFAWPVGFAIGEIANRLLL